MRRRDERGKLKRERGCSSLLRSLSLSSLDPPHASLHTSLPLSLCLCLSTTTAPRSLKESPPLCDVTIAKREREREIKDEDEEEEGGIEKFGGVIQQTHTHTQANAVAMATPPPHPLLLISPFSAILAVAMVTSDREREAEHQIQSGHERPTLCVCQ